MRHREESDTARKYGKNFLNIARLSEESLFSALQKHKTRHHVRCIDQCDLSRLIIRKMVSPFGKNSRNRKNTRRQEKILGGGFVVFIILKMNSDGYEISFLRALSLQLLYKFSLSAHMLSDKF